MKNNQPSWWLCGWLVLTSASLAPAAIVLNADWAVNQAIPDGNPVGITASQTFQNLPSSPLTDVSVNLNLSGGYNGDLVGYLTLQDVFGHMVTQFLLNRVGTTPSNPFGSSGSGFNIILSDRGTANGSIQNAAGLPTGTWLPGSASTLASTFGGLTANGTWTLFLADLSVGGGTTTLNSWGLEISAVALPEPASIGLIFGLGGMVFVVCGNFLGHRRSKLQKIGGA